jgi:cytochrome c556
MTRTTLLAFSAVALLGVCGAVAAAPLSGNQALAVAKARETHMKAFGDATKVIYNNLQSSSPDIGAIQQQAARIDALAPKLLTWFPAGTAVGVGESRAKPEIWQKPEDFAIKAHDFQTAAQQFEVAAKTGDVGQIKPAFQALGKSCKACHDPYRAPEKH